MRTLCHVPSFLRSTPGPAVIHLGPVFFLELIMGEPVGLVYTSGIACTVCWGLGKTFGPFGTPSKVYLTWAGLTAPYVAGNKTFIGIQIPVAPCFWEFSDGVNEGFWQYDPIFSIAKIRNVGALPFFQIAGPPCTLVCDNGAGKTCTIS